MSTVEKPGSTGPGGAATHTVTNQSVPLADYNVFEADTPLVEAVRREGGDWAVDRVRAVGELAGRARRIELGRLANENPPMLRTHDRYGNRIDEVEFHPAWHGLHGHGASSTACTRAVARRRSPARTSARRAVFMRLSQVEAGHGCPISMTYAVVPALRRSPDLAAAWEPRVLLARLRPALRARRGQGRRHSAAWR